MVPTWASVVIALGASAIAAVAGGFESYLAFRGTKLTAQGQVREAWRDRMREAAEGFCVASNTVASTARSALFADPEVRHVSSDDLDAQWKDLRRAQIGVDLILVTSSSSDTADALVTMIRAGVAAVTAWSAARGRIGDEKDAGEQDPEAWIEEARMLFMEEERKYDAFLQAAHDALAPDAR